MRAVLLAVITAFGMVGCVGTVNSGGGGGTVGSGTNPNPGGSTSMAKQMFENNVWPIIHNPGAASDCSSCHSASGPVGNVTGFVADNVNDAYATITSYQTVVGNFAPSAAGILTRISSTDPHVTQRGRSYTDAQKQAITDWLNQEVTERNGTGGTGSGTGSGTETPAQATSRVLNQWSACMTIDNFNAANMAQAWGQMQANNGSKCESCHATGGQGFIATEVAETGADGPGLFTVIDTNKYYLIQYFSVDLSGGASAAKMIINNTSFMGVSQGQPPHTEHPTFRWNGSKGQQALQQFYKLTNAALPGCMASQTNLNPPA